MHRNRWILIVAFATGLGVGWWAGADRERPRPVPPPAPAEWVGSAQLCPGAQSCGGRGEYAPGSGLPLPVRGF